MIDKVEAAARGYAGSLADSRVIAAAEGRAGSLAAKRVLAAAEGRSLAEAAGSATGFGRVIGISADQSIGINESLTREITRGPFSDPGIAERIASNPEYYRRLASYIADELKREAVTLAARGHANSVQVVIVELTRLQNGFESVATELAEPDPGAFERAGSIISGLRDGFSEWYETYAELVGSIEKLAVISMAVCVLHQFGGASGDLAAAIAYSVVNKEKLSDILKAWKRKKD